MALTVAPCANKIYVGSGETTDPQTHKTKECEELVDRWYHPWGAGSEQRSTARPVPPQDPPLVSKIIKSNNLNNYGGLIGLKTNFIEMTPERPEAMGAKGGVWYLKKMTAKN